MLKFRAVFGLGIFALLVNGSFLQAREGSTSLVMTKGVCAKNPNSGKMACSRINDVPPLTFRSCVDGNSTAALETCFNEGDSCFIVESKKYQPDTFCRSARDGNQVDVLAESVPFGQ